MKKCNRSTKVHDSKPGAKGVNNREWEKNPEWLYNNPNPPLVVAGVGLVGGGRSCTEHKTTSCLCIASTWFAAQPMTPYLAKN